MGSHGPPAAVGVEFGGQLPRVDPVEGGGEDVPSGKTVKIRTNGTDNNDSIYGYFTVPAGGRGDEGTFDFTGDVLTLQANTAKGAWVKVTNVIGGSNEIWHAEVISQTVALVDNS